MCGSMASTVPRATVFFLKKKKEEEKRKISKSTLIMILCGFMVFDNYCP